VPKHDRRRGANVITTLTPPHRFTPELLEELRTLPAPAIEALAQPRVMLAVGGAAKVWRFSDVDIECLAAAIKRIGEAGASFMVTTSRRTPEAVHVALAAALQPFQHILYSGQGENPYAQFLAKADLIIVTADSVSMTGEALASGRPVYVFSPSGGSEKFRRYHEALKQVGATRELKPELPVTFDWAHAPIFAADQIARAIEERWQNRARFIVTK